MATQPTVPRRKIGVRLADALHRSTESVAWYPGTSPEALELAIRGALGLAPDAAIYATEQSSGFCVVLNEFLPDGTVLRVHCVEDKDAIAERAAEKERNETLKARESGDPASRRRLSGFGDTPVLGCART